MPLNPFDWDAGPFLILYAAAVISAAATGWLLPRWHRPAGRSRPVTGAAELAVLAHGPTRLAEMRVVERLEEGSLHLSDKRFHRRSFGAPGRGDSWPELCREYGREARGVRRRLAADGLMLDEAALALARWQAMLPPGLVLLFGAARLVVGTVRGRPVGLLLMLMVAMLAVAAILWRALDQRTEAGRRACAEARRASDRLRRAPTRSETAMAVALFGTGVLAASHLAHFHQLRTNGGKDGGSGGGSGDGGEGGDGGGDGGGCGGCGGD